VPVDRIETHGKGYIAVRIGNTAGNKL